MNQKQSLFKKPKETGLKTNRKIFAHSYIYISGLYPIFIQHQHHLSPIQKVIECLKMLLADWHRRMFLKFGRKSNLNVDKKSWFVFKRLLSWRSIRELLPTLRIFEKNALVWSCPCSISPNCQLATHHFFLRNFFFGIELVVVFRIYSIKKQNRSTKQKSNH